MKFELVETEKLPATSEEKESYLEYLAGILARLLWGVAWGVCAIIALIFCAIWAIFEPFFKE